MIRELEGGKWVRAIALLLTTSLTAPTMLAGCGSSGSSTPPPIDDTRGGRTSTPMTSRPQARTGMSTKQKMVLLAGAAALYYMYKKHQAKAGAGQQIQYYRSKNGRVYYREPNNPKQVHWVTPPAQGYRVPAEEATAYRDMEGYENSRSGRGIDDLFPMR